MGLFDSRGRECQLGRKVEILARFLMRKLSIPNARKFPEASTQNERRSGHFETFFDDDFDMRKKRWKRIKNSRDGFTEKTTECINQETSENSESEIARGISGALKAVCGDQKEKCADRGIEIKPSNAEPVASYLMD